MAAFGLSGRLVRNGLWIGTFGQGRDRFCPTWHSGIE